VKKFAINGSFLLERITGIQRYAFELICALDKLKIENIKIELIVPKKALNIPKLQNIKIVKYGSIKKVIIWEQLNFTFYCITRKAIPLNLRNITPLLKPCGISAIHDVSYKANPQFFDNFYGFLSRTWHKTNYWFICKFSKKIITVSEFSKSEIMKYYKVKPERIFVIPDAWQHIANADCSNANKSYFFAMSSVAKNKNFKWILEVAKRNSNLKFKIAGSLNPKRFGENFNFSKFPNVEFLGYVSDERAKTLMQNAIAFLFPSLYEGFGLPPLEALAMKTPVIISDIPVHREVYGDSAHYIDPHKYDADLEKILQEPVAPANQILERFSWEKSAGKLMEILI
jgi:glycosyltransferase involved in cell wall biosynthesis